MKKIKGLCLPYILMFIMIALVVLRDVAGWTVNKYLIVFIAFVICFVSNTTELLYLIALITPLHSALCGTYIVGIALFFYLFRNQKKEINFKHLLVFCLLFIEFILEFYYNCSILEYIKFSTNFLCLFLIAFDSKEIERPERIILFFILGYFVALGIVWGQLLQHYTFSQILSSGIRFGTISNFIDTNSSMHVSFNANDFGCISMLSALFSLLLWKKKESNYYLVIFVLSVFMNLMSLSRGANISMMMGIVLFFLLTSDNVPKTLRNLIVIIIVFVLCYLSVNFLFPNYWDALQSRFDYTQRDFLNGRTVIWKYYNSELVKHPLRLLFGVGLQDYTNKFGFLYACHNATQEVVVAWGIVGLLIIIAIFCEAIKVIKRNNKSLRLFQIIPLICTLVAFQAGQGFSGYQHMEYVLICFMAMLINYDSYLDDVCNLNPES